MSTLKLGEKNINVLVADDYFLFRKGLVGVLKNFSYVNFVDEAFDDKNVFDLLKKKNYDLIFMGYPMKTINEETATQLINKQSPKTKMIAVSLLEDSFTLRRMFLSGYHGYLHKRDNEQEFSKAIHTVFSGKKYFNEKIIEKLLGESEDECIARLRKQFSITQDEFKLIQLVCEGNTNKEIEKIMNISVRTAEKYRNSAYHKIGVSNSMELIRFAIRQNIINVESIKGANL